MKTEDPHSEDPHALFICLEQWYCGRNGTQYAVRELFRTKGHRGVLRCHSCGLEFDSERYCLCLSGRNDDNNRERLSGFSMEGLCSLLRLTDLTPWHPFLSAGHCLDACGISKRSRRHDGPHHPLFRIPGFQQPVPLETLDRYLMMLSPSCGSTMRN